MSEMGSVWVDGMGESMCHGEHLHENGQVDYVVGNEHEVNAQGANEWWSLCMVGKVLRS